MKQNLTKSNRALNPVLKFTAVGLIALGAFSAILFGCASTPNAVERGLFTLETNMLPKVTTFTNVVNLTNTVQKTEVQTVFQTNAQNVLVPIYVTNAVPVEVVTSTTNTVTQTNFVPVIQEKAGPGSTAALGVASGIGGMFGVGGLVNLIGGSLISGFLTFRNRQFKLNAAVDAGSLATTAAQTLAQNIETLKSILSTTPQGQQLQPLISNYLMSHQKEAGVIDVVSQIVDENVSEPNAKASADEILGLLKQLQSPAPTGTKATI